MNDSIGAVLKEARRRRGLRVKDLAAQTKAAISPSYLSCIENDLRLPSEDLLLELAELLSLDSRQLYMELVRKKAPPAIRDALFGPTTPVASSYQALRSLTLEEVVEQAAQSVQARRDAQEARREVVRLKRLATSEDGTLAGTVNSGKFLARWFDDLERYRILIERTEFELALTIDGDAAILHHTIGLTPRPDKGPIVSLEHLVNLTQTNISDKDGDFKLLEAPSDLPVEVQRLKQGAEQLLIRIVFPDGLKYDEGIDRRVSYTLRSTVQGAYTMESTNERAGEERVSDILRDDRGSRGRFHVTVDKPCEILEIVVRFPHYYIPDGVEAWAGTQLPAHADDNFIDMEVCTDWSLEIGVDYRATLRVERPLVGMRYGVMWRPLTPDGYSAVKERLGIDEEEVSPQEGPARVSRARRRKSQGTIGE